MEITYRETSVVPIPNKSLDGAFPRANSGDEAVYLIDGPRSLREGILSFLAEAGITAVAFASAPEYFDFKRRDTAGCIILNISLPDLSGLQLQRRLAEKANPPVVFIGDRCDIASTVCAMKAGAIEFLTTPIDWRALVAAVHSAFAQDRRQRQQKAEFAKLQERFSLLTPRERDVLPLIVGGLLNKQAASVLSISEVTLQIHRSQIMRKMRADSFADLVRMAVKLRIRYWRKSHPIDGFCAPRYGARTAPQQQESSSIGHSGQDASLFLSAE